MGRVDPEKAVGQQSVIIVFELPDGNQVWHQGAFGHGKPVGLKTRYAFCNMVANAKPIWQGIPDDAKITAILPHPLRDKVVKIDAGEHAGKTGRVTDTKPPDCKVVVEIRNHTGNQLVEVSPYEITFVR